MDFLQSPKFITEFEYFFEDESYKLSLQLEPLESNEESSLDSPTFSSSFGMLKFFQSKSQDVISFFIFILLFSFDELNILSQE